MNLKEKLEAVLNGANIISGEFIGADFCHDELPGGLSYKPELVVEARSSEDAAAVLKLCSEENIPVTVRGAGTGQEGGSVPIKGGIVLSLKEMNKILDFDEENKILRVQPGVLLQDVKAEAESRGLYYPPDPGEPTATIGGNAATNASGPSALKYGKTRDYIADALIVFADGHMEKLSDKPENTAVLGGEGTLGVITELSLRLIEKPAADALLLFPFMDTDTAVKAAQTILAGGYEPAVCEFMDTDLTVP